MKIAEKPKTTSRPCDWTPPSYAKLIRHERACAERLANEVKEITRKQNGSARKWKEFH